MKHILVLNDPDKAYSPLFEDYGKLIYDERKLENCDLVVFTGGSDVSPEFYGDNKLSTTYSNLERDKLERKIFNYAQIMAIPMVGICRGMQFINVMNGGLIVQDVNNHTNCIHNIVTDQDEDFEVAGDHHQMCIPQGNYELLAWSQSLSSHYRGGEKFSIWDNLIPDDTGDWQVKEPEAIYWPRTNSFGVQYHPEWMEEDSRGYEYFHELLNKFVFNEG